MCAKHHGVRDGACDPVILWGREGGDRARRDANGVVMKKQNISLTFLSSRTKQSRLSVSFWSEVHLLIAVAKNN
jgi:hypothetical protein